jgi:hypothetical protein
VWVFVASSNQAATLFFRFVGAPVPGTPMNPSPVASSAIDMDVWGVAYSEAQDLFVAVGAGTVAGRNVAWSSDGGLSWNSVPSPSPFDGGAGNSVAYSCFHDRWVVVGNGATRIAVSPDGMVWQNIASSFFTSGADVEVNSLGVFLAIGTGSQSAVSIDGLSWSPNAQNPLPSVTLTGVAYSEALQMWMVLGPAVPNSIAWSHDGTNWLGAAPVFGAPIQVGGGVAASNKYTTCSRTTLLNGTLGTNVVIIGDAQITAGATLTGQLNVTGNLKVVGSWNLSSSAVVVVGGSLQIADNSKATVAVGSQIFVNGHLAVGSSSTLTLVVTTAPTTNTIQATIVSYGSSSGVFVVNPSVVANFSSSGCTQLGAPVPAYGSSSLDVTIPVTSSCGLSSGAIAGIVIGAVCVIAIVVFIAIWRWRTVRRTRERTQNIEFARKLGI